MSSRQNQERSTEQIQKKLDSYYRRIDQLKTIQLRKQTEIKLIQNDPEAWKRSQKFGKRINPDDALKTRLEELSAKNARLQLLIMQAEGGTITQSMFDYSRGKLKENSKNKKSLIDRFNLLKPNGEPYAVGDTYIPTEKDRFTLIDNLEEILDQREIAEADNTPSSDFPTVKITDPNNKYKTIEIDKEDYYSGTDFRNEQEVIDSSWANKLRLQQIQRENNESKLDLTKELTIGDF